MGIVAVRYGESDWCIMLFRGTLVVRAFGRMEWARSFPLG